MDRTTCTEPQCLYKDALYLYLYLYSPYGPYDLYRASVTVQGCTLPLPIPLLPLWTVRPVQSLSACTAVHFTCFYFLGILEPKIISQWFEAFALLLCYSAFIGSSLPTFPDNLAVPYSSDCLTHSAAEAWNYAIQWVASFQNNQCCSLLFSKYLALFVINKSETLLKVTGKCILIILTFCLVSADIYSTSNCGVCTACLARTGLRMIWVMDERVLGAREMCTC